MINLSGARCEDSDDVRRAAIYGSSGLSTLLYLYTILGFSCYCTYVIDIRIGTTRL